MGTGFPPAKLITDFGRTSNLVPSSSLRAAAQRDETDVTTSDVLLQVDQTFLETLRAQSLLRVAEETVKARQVVADQVSALARSNLKSGLDVWNLGLGKAIEGVRIHAPAMKIAAPSPSWRSGSCFLGIRDTACSKLGRSPRFYIAVPLY